SHLVWCFVIGAVILVAFCVYWDPLRQLTIEALSFPLEVLDYSEEDVGGPEGAEVLLKAMQARARKDRFCDWLLSHQLLKLYAPTEQRKAGANSHSVKHSAKEPAVAVKTGVNVPVLKGQSEEHAPTSHQQSTLVVVARMPEPSAPAQAPQADPELVKRS